MYIYIYINQLYGFIFHYCMVPIFPVFINIRYITYTTYFRKSPTVDIYIYIVHI